MLAMLTRLTSILLVLLALPSLTRAEVKTQELDYREGETTLQGFVAWDDSIKGKRPGVLVVHEWWGHNQHARDQAIRLAKAGYVAFALDMFGKGKVAKHPDDAKAFVAEATASFPREKARFDAALAQLKKRPEVVLDMLRSGEQLGVVATFHGALGSKLKAKPGSKARVLILHGKDDPMITQEQVATFKQEMDAAKVRYEVVEYPGAKHGFTNPAADKAGVPGLAYDAKADEASFAALRKALDEEFNAKK
jgi:dienelactone hydrolase